MLFGYPEDFRMAAFARMVLRKPVVTHGGTEKPIPAPKFLVNPFGTCFPKTKYLSYLFFWGMSSPGRESKIFGMEFLEKRAPARNFRIGTLSPIGTGGRRGSMPEGAGFLR